MMELLYDIVSNRSIEEKASRVLTRLDVPRQASMIRELSDQRRKLLQKSSRTSQILRPVFDHSTTLSDEYFKYLQIAPLVPDEVIQNPNDLNVRSFGAAVIFADVSGFTDLSDEYKTVDNGASKLSAVLNCYLGIMVQEILAQNGDILKYGGDAFLAIFKVNARTSYQSAVQKAIDVSIIIQKNCKNFLTEVGIMLNVKIAISCGEVYFSLIGDENLSHYVIVGEPIWQVKRLQQDYISAGEILLTQNAWFLIRNAQYTYEFNRKKRCYKITGFRDQTNVIRQQYEAMHFYNEAMHVQEKAQHDVSEARSNLSFSYNLSTQNEQRFTVRQTINIPLMSESRKSLRRFVISPVLNAIDMGDSIDTMTEMRYVVIVFANFVVADKNPLKICEITNLIFTRLNSIVSSFQGSLNKVSLFDKDMMYLSIFGLRGQKHENECEVGLRCAHEIHETFKTWSQIKVVSIGVTSGNVYCGICGHTLRREYSVVSVTVNIAARLMIAYPGMVSCDEDTLIQSKMSFSRHFKKLPIRNLKGLKEAVRAYEFIDAIDFEEVDVMNELENSIPMVGREEVMQRVHFSVTAAIAAFNNNELNHSGACCVMIKGDGQQGKSRVINELYRVCVYQNLKCLRLILNAKHTSMPFWTVKYCLQKILESENAGNIEDIIVNKLSDLIVEADYLSALNSIFDIHLPAQSSIANDTHGEIQKILLRLLCHNLSSNFWIVFIDDADYIDSDSFNLLPSLFETKSLFFILTIGKHCRNWTMTQKEIYVNEFVTIYRLQPIDKKFHKDIACHSINVSAIPIKFERFLHENSHGNPGWIVTCAKTLLNSGKLCRKGLMIKEAISKGLILVNNLISDDNVVRHHEEDIFSDVFKLTQKVVEHTLSQINEINVDEIVIYVVVLRAELTSIDFASKHTTRKLMLYDSLSYHDQLTCKCAALLGNEFDRDMLNYLLPSSKERKVAKGIVQLFQQNILACASSKPSLSRGESFRRFSDMTTCYCKNPKIPDSCRDLPKYGSCSFIKFQDESFRRYIYETLTEKQRIDYHKRCISYLYYQTKKCSNCNNDRFEVIDELALNATDGVVTTSDKKIQMNKNVLNTLKLFSKNCNVQSLNKHIPIVLNFINHSFYKCSCISILYSAFSITLQHCHGKDMSIKLLHSQVILADICIKLDNIPRALILLDEVYKKFDDKTNMDDNNSHFITYLRGRVLMLRGICSEKMLQCDEAIKYFYAASEIYEIKFPQKFNLAARCKLTHVKHIIKNSTKQQIELSRVDSLIIEQSSFLMQLFYEYYMKAGNFKMAKLAAFWSLKEALRSTRRVGTIAKCYANVIHICIISDNLNVKLDVEAINEIFRSICENSLDADSLSDVVKLYAKIVQLNMLKNKITTAIMVGEIAWKICFNLPSSESLLEIFPLHFLLLMKMQRIDELKKLLIQFHGIVRHHDDKNGLVWFYALAIDLILDTCHSIVTYDECYKFFLDSTSSTIYEGQEHEASVRFKANFWLWSIRNDMIERSEGLMELINAKFKLHSHSINDAMSGIRVTEALILHYLKAMETKNISLQLFLARLIKYYLNILKYDVKSSRHCFHERLLLLELHFEMINQKFSKKFVTQMSMLEQQALMKKDYFVFNYIRYLKFNLCRSGKVKNYWKELNMMKIISYPQQRIIFYILPFNSTTNK